MKLVSCFTIVLILSGCLGTNTKYGDEFYTWVDERGNIQTLRKQPVIKSKEKNAATSREAVQQSQKLKQNNFDPKDFQTEEQVKAKLRDTKLFAWTEDAGRQQVIEKDLESERAAIQKDHGTKTSFQSDANKAGYKAFREGFYVSWLDIFSKEISLADYYRFNKQLNRDYLLIDLADMPHMQELRVKSFIASDKVALPQMVFLDDRYSQVSPDSIPFENYFEETWHSYGYLEGAFNVPDAALYLLVYTGNGGQPVELDGKLIKGSDLGRIFFEPIQ